MAADKTATWSQGESALWISPTTGLDALWSEGESRILDTPSTTPAAGGTITVTGGGTLTAQGWKAAGGALAVVGGGALTVVFATGKAGAVVAAGQGAAAAAGRKAGAGSTTAAGAGEITAQYRPGKTGSTTVGGAGAIAAAGADSTPVYVYGGVLVAGAGEASAAGWKAATAALSVGAAPALGLATTAGRAGTVLVAGGGDVAAVAVWKIRADHLTLCFNLAALAATQLTRHDFTGLGTVAAVPVGCGPEAGLVAIEAGERDPGEELIAARFELAATDFGTEADKQIARVLVGIDTDGALEALVRYDEGPWRAYPLKPTPGGGTPEEVQAPTSRRWRGRYAQIGLRNVAGADFTLHAIAAVVPLHGGRRGVR